MPSNDKNETTRFLGDGVSFKAKLIGILEVSEARGDRMCQEALSDLKMAIRAAGEHKQRITINIAIDGLRLRDEKTGDSLYHHPVHKISFIAQDMTDSRAFGYIFGSPDTGHRFFGIKTDKAASQVVIAMRDLFQVVFALKKKEIELAKQHLEKTRYPTSPLFTDSSTSSSKFLQLHSSESSKGHSESKPSTSTTEPKSSGTAVADLVDLELELNSLQQGLNQMERITPSEPFGSKDDPFGDSFITYPKPILPPPPSGRERASRTSDSSSIFSPRTPHTSSLDTSNADSGLVSKKDFSFSEFNSSHEEPSSGDWFTPSAGNSLFEDLVVEPTKDEKHELAKQEILSQFDVFTELDPLELKNPPKKVLNELVNPNQPEQAFHSTVTQPKGYPYSNDPFGEDPFVKEDPFAEADFTKQDPFDTEFTELKLNNLDRGRNIPIKDPKSVQFSKANFEVNFEDKPQWQENVSLDVSSGSEGAPEPPPRPAVGSVKPPPLPPKKQEFCKPPRPVLDESHYDYMDNYETAPNSLDYKSADDRPPIPVPVRKSKFESDFTTAPERPKKQFNLNTEEDYLTPISLPEKRILLPPPQKTKKVAATVASLLESKPNVTTSVANSTLDGLDITLSQLTLSGLNELASKLNIPASQLSNMTLVQLTNYLSNVIKAKTVESTASSEPFKADFAANFNNSNTSENYDRYAVFRELMQEEIKQTKIDTEPEQLKEEEKEKENNINSNISEQEEDKYAALREIVDTELKKDQENQNGESEKVEDINNLNLKACDEKEGLSAVIEYEEEEVEKSPVKLLPKSPVPVAVTDIIQNNTRLTSGSLSDVVSGSSPEGVDNTGSNEEKKINDTTGESWAIFDQANIQQEAPVKEKSEEGVSPWSSDSKEFVGGNGSPTDWKRGDSGSGGDRWSKRRKDEGWWDTSAEPEPEVQYYSQNRRSTDSYDEEYECYDRPRRRRQGNYSGQAAGGHSSSSRDVSPWEEEPRRREPRQWRYPRFESHRDPRHDSWDEEDDYDEEEERFRWSERHSNRESDRHGRDQDWGEDRRHRRRNPSRGDYWCCPDWEQSEHDKSRYCRRNPEVNSKWRKHDDRYRSRESQESPWEDERPEEPDHYPNAKRNWKQRPSSASEMDRRAQEVKSRHYLGSGGSDGERDRRYKSARRSRSRDSQYAEGVYRYKEPPVRSQHPHRPKQHQKDLDFNEAKKPELDLGKKSSTLARSKKTKDSPKSEESTNTFPRKSSRSKFENDFVPTEEASNRKYYDDFESSELESPVVGNRAKSIRQQSMFERLPLDKERRQIPFKESKSSFKSKSLFEDDFSPSAEKEEDNICSIKEENDPGEEQDVFGPKPYEAPMNGRRKIMGKGRLRDANLKKSDSVNIFARESDPFDDDFFSGEGAECSDRPSPRNTELRWTEDFEDFEEEK